MHFFVQLCRQNYQSENFEFFSAFKSSLKAFDNMLVNIFAHEYRVIGILNFSLKPKMWETGGNFRLQNGLNYGLVVNIQKGAIFRLSLKLCMIFKICSQLSENAIFEKFIKILSLQKLQLVKCFSVCCTKLFTCA